MARNNRINNKQTIRKLNRKVAVLAKSVPVKSTKNRELIKKVTSNVLSTVGGMAFGAPGSQFGALAGNYIGGKLSEWSGNGDYVINGPLVKGGSMTNASSPPVFKGGLSTVISHREYIQDLYSGPTLVDGTTLFDYVTFDLNPGLATTFPWLAQVAQNYEEFRFRRLAFVVKSTSGNALNSTNTSLGTVIASTEYNVLNSPFVDKMSQENYEFAQSAKPSESFMHGVECAPNRNVLARQYIRTTDVPAGADQRMYDVGRTQISTMGMQAAKTNIAEIWADYTVELYKPRVPNQVNNNSLSEGYNLISPSPTNPLGTSRVQFHNSNIGLTLTNNTISFPISKPSGSYLMVWVVTGSVAGSPNVAPSFVATSNCNFNGLTNNMPYGGTVSSVTSLTWGYVTVTGPGAKITLTGGSNFPTSSAGQLYVSGCRDFASASAYDESKLYYQFRDFCKKQGVNLKNYETLAIEESSYEEEKQDTISIRKDSVSPIKQRKTSSPPMSFTEIPGGKSNDL